MQRLLCAVFFAAAVPVLCFAADTQTLLMKLESLKLQLMSLQQASVVANSTPICDVPTTPMRRGMTGDPVSKLQQFLSGDRNIFPEATISGYFGVLTEKAVQRWQAAHGVVSSGTPQTTGYGVVGPKTLAAMRVSWCILSRTNTSPFTPPTGVTPPVNGVTPPPPPVQPRIMFSAPGASTTVYKGNSLVAAWKSDAAPVAAKVSLYLIKKSGENVGLLKGNLDASSQYYWLIPSPPQPTTSTCTSDPATCLAEIAQTSPSCDTLCSVDAGLYKFLALLISSGKEVARAESRIFSVGGAALSASDTSFTGTQWDFSAINYGTTTYSNVYSNAGTGTTTTENPALSCLYSGIPYTEGITIEINCADVTTAGQSCGNFGGMKLSCKGGKWVDQNGVAQNIRNVTTTGGAGSCTTPWGATIVASGNEVPQFPFFTNGVYPTNAGAPLIMKCSGGSWQTCDTVGDHCG